MTALPAHRALVQALPALALAACIGTDPQRVPGPLVLPLASADEPPVAERAGSLAVTVQRDSDPVWVRRPGERGDYGLPTTYPMAAPNYAEMRRDMAKKIGLGRKRGAAAPAAAAPRKASGNGRRKAPAKG